MVRFALRRQITESLLGPDGVLHIFTLPSQVEQVLAKVLQQTDDGREIVVDPMVAKKVLTALIAKCDELVNSGRNPVLVISPPLRGAIRRVVEKYITTINILSHNEISENVRLESSGAVEISFEEVTQ